MRITKSPFPAFLAAVPVTAILFVLSCGGSGPLTLDGPYLGQTPPTLAPEIFAPGLVSTGGQEMSIAFAPDGREVYLLVAGPGYSPRHMLHSRWSETGWGDFREVEFFSPDRVDSYPFVAPDGRVFFNSMRWYQGAPMDRGREIWFVDRTHDGWTEPERIAFSGGGPNTGTFPSVASNGNLYFNARVGGAESDIFVSRFVDGRYERPERMGDTVNSPAGDYHPFIAPDESYLLFDSVRDSSRAGSNDIYISYRDDAGTWSNAQNMGGSVNTDFSDLRPFVTADGKFLFFVSDRMTEESHASDSKSIGEIRRALDQPGNGLQDIYWVRFSGTSPFSSNRGASPPM